MKKTLVDLFEESVRLYPNNTFLLEKTDKKFEPTTYAEVKNQESILHRADSSFRNR